MKHLVALSVWLLLACVASAAQESLTEAETQEMFSPGGTIRMHLGPGGYVVSGTAGNAIVITYRYKNPERLKRVRLHIKVVDFTADVSVENTPHDNFHATIQVPRRSNLWVRLSAGQVQVEGVEGDKDVESRAGEIDIEIPCPDQYGHRDASVLAGSLDASAFDVSKGGLWRSFKQLGPGKYRLHAHVTAGEINFRGSR